MAGRETRLWQEENLALYVYWHRHERQGIVAYLKDFDL